MKAIKKSKYPKNDFRLEVNKLLAEIYYDNFSLDKFLYKTYNIDACDVDTLNLELSDWCTKALDEENYTFLAKLQRAELLVL